MKDQRYKAIKSLIETNQIKGLEEVFTIIPLSVVRVDMKVNYSTLRKRIYAGDTLTLRDFRLMADLFGVQPSEVFKLALSDVQSKLSRNNPKKNLSK